VKACCAALLAAGVVAAGGACGGSSERGDEHAGMTRAADERAAAIRADADARTLFETLCAVCHTLSAAGATGEVGPNFDETRPSAEEVRVQVRRTIALPADQERALIEYVVANAGKGDER
jgi:mono/diheme cytochrome c family protein